MERPLPLVAVFLAFVFAGSANAQLNGVYTCANGNPGGAFDYADVGDFFTALEVQGVNGPVTLDIYDDGGPFTSKATYRLGDVAPFGVAGVSLANPLTIRAALGERPQIMGGGVASTTALSFLNVGYLTIEGLTFTGAPTYGIRWLGQGQQFSNVRIAGCRIHGITDGVAIWVSNPPQSVPVPGSPNTYESGPNALIIENNMIWDCKAASPWAIQSGRIYCTHGVECIVRHNTVVHLDAPDDFNLIGLASGLVHIPVEEVHSNVLYMTSASTATNPIDYPRIYKFPAIPLFLDHNIYFKQGNVAFDIVSWRAATNCDWNSIEADPMLVSVLPGFEDLHLLPGSPAINFSPVQSVTVDVDGEPRPVGLRDAGADEYIPPDTQLEYNAAPIAQAGVVNLGNVPVTGAQFSFTIRNTGPGALRLTASPAVALAPGANCDPATAVQAQPGALVIAPAAFTSFSLYIKAAVPGALDFVVSIPSNDPTKNPYTFTVSATGLGVPPPNMPAVATPGAGSVFAGPANGPFVVQVNPGTVLNNFVIDLTDPEADAITVVSITLLTANPAGILPPGTGIPLHPRLLQWFGTANASNPPGSYTWRLQFSDAVNLSIITSDVTIQILNTPPAHLPAATIAGSGSQAAPYECVYIRGDGAALQTELCIVTDANTGQTPFISQSIRAPANPGAVNFVFTLNAGTLTVAPDAMLTVAEAGPHAYEVRLSDGANIVGVHVSITVANPPMFFLTPAQLPDGQTSQPWSANLVVTGNIGAVSFAITAGALPTGLDMDTAGQISGTPAAASDASFTVQAQDATGATATRAFTLTIQPAPQPPDTGPGSGSISTGCTASAAAGLWVLLPMLVLARATRREDR